MAGTDYVDAKVVRGKAAFHTLLPLLAFLIAGLSALAGQVLIGLIGLLMLASVLGGPRWSLFGLTYRSVLRPALHLSPGRRELAAPHRFAETLGAVFLLVAAAFFLIGVAMIGWALVLMVAALAALNWLGGICIGCMLYPLALKLRPRAG